MNQQNQCLFKTRQYARVSDKVQKQLIELVMVREWKIKKAATSLSIKYPTAKHIIYRYRKTKILKKSQSHACKKRCLYKPIEKQSSQIKLICTKGGIPIQQKQKE